MDFFIICINLSFLWDHCQATDSICLKCIQEIGKIKIIAISASLGPFGPLNKPVGAPESYFSNCSIIWIDETIARPLTQIVAYVLKKSRKSRLWPFLLLWKPSRPLHGPVGAPAALFMDWFIICINLSFLWDHFQATDSIYSRKWENKDYSDFCFFGFLWGPYIGPWRPQNQFSRIFL